MRRYQFMIITGFFLACWALLATVWVLNVFGVYIYNPIVDSLIAVGCHMCAAINPILYGVMNKKLRNAMLDVIPKALSEIMYSKVYGKKEGKVQRDQSLVSCRDETVCELDDSQQSKQEEVT